jgi:proteic killer suppression protein
MEVDFANGELERLETDPAYSAGLSQALVKVFRKRMQQIRAAVDERDFYALKSLHFEKLSAARRHQHSMRLNDQYRLIVELQGEGSNKVVRIVGIEDYH